MKINKIIIVYIILILIIFINTVFFISLRESLRDLDSQLKETYELIGKVQEEQTLNYIALSEKYTVLLDEIDELKKQISKIKIENFVVNEQKVPVSDENNRLSINEKKQEGIDLFQKSEWNKAYSIFNEISDCFSNESDFIFMEYYSLFKSNPMDSTKYSIIKKNFEQLESINYSKKEIKEVLEYIKNEN